MTWEQAGKIAVVVVPVAGFVAWLGRLIVKIVAKKLNAWIKGLLSPIYKNQDKLCEDVQELKETIALTFEGVYKTIEAIKTGKKNGNLEKIQEKMHKHLLEKINPEGDQDNG